MLRANGSFEILKFIENDNSRGLGRVKNVFPETIPDKIL